jgi:hypothetical protein
MDGTLETLGIGEFWARLISYVPNRAGNVFGDRAVSRRGPGATRSEIAVGAPFLATHFLLGHVDGDAQSAGRSVTPLTLTLALIRRCPIAPGRAVFTWPVASSFSILRPSLSRRRIG